MTGQLPTAVSVLRPLAVWIAHIARAACAFAIGRSALQRQPEAVWAAYRPQGGVRASREAVPFSRLLKKSDGMAKSDGKESERTY